MDILHLIWSAVYEAYPITPFLSPPFFDFSNVNITLINIATST